MTPEQELRCADTYLLGKELRKRRSKTLELLNEYWKKEKFPINTDYNIKIPQIRDWIGNPCSIAYLIERSGPAELLNLVATQSNLVYIDDEKEGPLITGLERYGL